MTRRMEFSSGRDTEQQPFSHNHGEKGVFSYDKNSLKHCTSRGLKNSEILKSRSIYIKNTKHQLQGRMFKKARHLTRPTPARQDAPFHGQGRRPFGERSIHVVREHDKGPRTTLADFFNILLGEEDDMFLRTRDMAGCVTRIKDQRGVTNYHLVIKSGM
ncbi:MAG: hypothetical protein ACE10C_11120, partial [Candidatus Binatia bacterium]